MRYSVISSPFFLAFNNTRLHPSAKTIIANHTLKNCQIKLKFCHFPPVIVNFLGAVSAPCTNLFLELKGLFEESGWVLLYKKNGMMDCQELFVVSQDGSVLS